MFLLFHTPPFQRVSRWILLGSLSFFALSSRSTSPAFIGKPPNVTCNPNLTWNTSLIFIKWYILKLVFNNCDKLPRFIKWFACIHGNIIILNKFVVCISYQRIHPWKPNISPKKKGTISIGNKSNRLQPLEFSGGRVTCEFSREVRFDEDF